ncbi:MAG: hypothetical protein ABSA45_02805 [Verrucomicrobiota bacterium]
MKTRGDILLTTRPNLAPNRNFCLFVANKWKAHCRLSTYLRNMVTGKELATGCVDQTMPPTPDSNIVRKAGHRSGLPVRIVTKMCGAMESQVPVGYEDEGGFHYGAEMARGFF